MLDKYEKKVRVGEKEFTTTYHRANAEGREFFDKLNKKAGLEKVYLELGNGKRGFMWVRK